MLEQNPLFRRLALMGLAVIAIASLVPVTDESPKSSAAPGDSATTDSPSESPVDEATVDEWFDSTAELRDELNEQWQDIVSARFDAPPETGRDDIDSLHGEPPQQWGEFVTGVRTRLDTDEKKIALTFDACDSGYDPELMDFLKRRDIPATLFVSGFWINAHGDRLEEFADDSRFEIANHGMRHLPCSVSGREAIEIAGTQDVGEVFDEIEDNARQIRTITGQRPRYYRSGTAHYDEICVQIAEQLDHQVVNFDIIGDQGAVFSAEQVEKALLEAEAGSIVILHMNEPDSGTAEGVKKAVPTLKTRGFSFVTLSDVELK